VSEAGGLEIGLDRFVGRWGACLKQPFVPRSVDDSYRMSGKRGKNDAADAAAICEAVTVRISG